MSKVKTFIILFYITTVSLCAQVGIGSSTAPKGALDVNMTNYGVVVKAVSLSSITDSTTITNPNGGSLVNGTLIYNNGLGGLTDFGYYYWNNGIWIALTTETVGDIKFSFETADNGGWYKLDGRAVTSLSATAKAQAIALGFATNLPTMSDEFFKGKNGSETMASVVGSNSINVLTTNMPNYSLPTATTSTDTHSHTGTVNSAGAHTHSYTDRGNTSNNSNYGGSNSADDNYSGLTYTTGSAGVHAHTLTTNPYSHSQTVTVNSGGSGTAIVNKPNALVSNVFVYLGK